MWHEARKQEKKIRCMLVDYQRRAQRRKDYYDKIKADPTQFLQLHGRPCKIHLDPAVCIAANSNATMMPWQGNEAILIDRFDVRAHLDYIPEIPSNIMKDEELLYEERQINYERYRILVQNDFFNIPEGKFLHQINLEEKFGHVLKNTDDSNSTKKKKGAAIGYSYNEDNSAINSSYKKVDEGKNNFMSPASGNVNAEGEDSESDIDLDLTVDVSKIETQQANELNACAHAYGMVTNDFFSFLNNDLEEAENLRIAKEHEEEKAMFSGRKSRKERRAFRERTLVGRKLSPPSYAWRKSPSYEEFKALVSRNRSRSKSLSPVNSGKITYITSFGGDEPASSSSSVSKSRSISREKYWVKRVKRSRSSDVEFKKNLSYRRRSRSPISNSGPTSKRKRSESPSPLEQKSALSVQTSTKYNLEIPPVTNSSTSESITLPRYYGRNREKSSSELSLSSDDDSCKQSRTAKNKSNKNASVPRIGTSNKDFSCDKLTPQERLKRKRQVLLNKQYKADKRAEREKVLKQVQERMDRAEEMKEISIKMRRRQRMMRHGDSPKRNSSRSSSSSNTERSVSRSPYSRRQYKRHDKYRSESTSSCSSDSSKHRQRTTSWKYKSSLNRSRSRSYSRSQSRSPHKRYGEDRAYKRNSSRDYDRASRDDRKNDYRARRSPKGDDENEVKRDKIRENDRHGLSRRYSGRRSSSRDGHSSKYDY